jgi:hypothetical protein
MARNNSSRTSRRRHAGEAARSRRVGRVVTGRVCGGAVIWLEAKGPEADPFLDTVAKAPLAWGGAQEQAPPPERGGRRLRVGQLAGEVPA